MSDLLMDMNPRGVRYEANPQEARFADPLDGTFEDRRGVQFEDPQKFDTFEEQLRTREEHDVGAPHMVMYNMRRASVPIMDPEVGVLEEVVEEQILDYAKLKTIEVLQMEKEKLEFFKMTDKGLLLTRVLEMYPVKAEYVRAILDSHKIDEDGSIQATELLEFFKTLYVDEALRNDDMINVNKLRSEVEAFELQIKNNDNRIKISDLALLLPAKERLFLKFISFCRKKITSVEFFELLLRYDNDKTGSLNQSQLYQMVKDFADEIGAPEIHCQDCVRYILALFNADDEATLELTDFPRLFNMEGNFLKKLKPHGRFSAIDFDNIIMHYDKDGNGTIDAGGELMALIADVLEYADIRVNGELLFEMVDAALELCHKTDSKKLDRDDLKVILTQLPKQRMG